MLTIRLSTDSNAAHNTLSEHILSISYWRLLITHSLTWDVSVWTFHRKIERQALFEPSSDLFPEVSSLTAYYCRSIFELRVWLKLAGRKQWLLKKDYNGVWIWLWNEILYWSNTHPVRWLHVTDKQNITTKQQQEVELNEVHKHSWLLTWYLSFSLLALTPLVVCVLFYLLIDLFGDSYRLKKNEGETTSTH